MFFLKLKNFKIIFLNIFCIFFLIYFSILASRQLTSTVINIDSDYASLYHIFNQNKNFYDVFYTAQVISIHTENKVTKVSIAPKITPHINLNTPSMSLFVKFMVNLSNKTSINTTVWILTDLFCAAVSLAVLMQWIDSLSSKACYFFPLLLSLWLSWPNIYNLNQGEVALFLLPLLSIAFVADDAKKYNTACILLALLASLKLFFLIFVFLYIARRQWRLFFIFCLSFLLFFLLSRLYFSWADYLSYFQLLQNHALIIQRAIASMNGSILGVIANIVRLSGLSIPVDKVFIISGVLTLYVFIRWFIFDYRHMNKLTEFRDAIRFSFLIVLALLCSPLGWLYYYLFLLVPIAVIFNVSQKYALSKTLFIFFTLALILPLFCFFDLSDKSIVLQIIRALVLFSSLLCWLVCLRLLVYTILDKKPVIVYHRTLLLALIFAYSSLSFIVFSSDVRMNYMLQWNKTNYFKTVAPDIWVNKI